MSLSTTEKKRLQEERGQLLTECERILETARTAQRALTAEENGRYDELFDRAANHKRSIELDNEQRALEQLENEPANPGGDRTPEERTAAPEYEQRMSTYLRSTTQEQAIQHRATLIAGNDALSGYLMPKAMRETILTGLNNNLHMMRLGTVHMLTNAVSLGMPYLAADVDDAEWTTEIQTIPEDASMSFGKRELAPKYLTKAIALSTRAARHRPDLPAYVGGRLGYKVEVAAEKSFMIGDGILGALGVFVPTENGIPTSRDISTGMEATNVTADGFKEAFYSLKEQYRRSPKCAWLLSRDCVKRTSKLVDGEGRYIWSNGLETNEPQNILGKQVVESEYVPNTFTASQYVGLFGDMTYYEIAMSLQMTIRNLVEIRALQNQIVYKIEAELDGMPVLPEAFARLKLAAE